MPRVAPVFLGILAMAAVACSPSADIPTEPEARAFLQDVVSAAQAGDMNHLCELANCLRDDFVNPPKVPSNPPTVVTTWVLDQSTTPQGQQTSGGRVLVLCGRDADSQPYRSEMLVIRANGKLHTASYKYWLSGSVGASGSPTTASEPPTPAGCT
jgi:hypothetical protein